MKILICALLIYKKSFKLFKKYIIIFGNFPSVINIIKVLQFLFNVVLVNFFYQ